jgi:murein DD-endopeptidase MepM/ murein hydrolase activator NlpD
MPFDKYHIVILNKNGGSHSLRVRGGVLLLLCIVFAGLIVGNIWLWENYSASQTAAERLSEAERIIENQSSQLMSLVNRISDLQSGVFRVQQFDAKLRLMMDINQELADVRSLDTTREEFSRLSLPLHRQELMVRKMHSFLKELADDVRMEEVTQQDLLHAVRDNREIFASLPSIWPVTGFLSSRFGRRISPFTGSPEFHSGLDISARMGTPIVAPAKGTVTSAGVQGAYGNVVVIQHGSGLVTRYAHLQRFIVKVGDVVSRGTVIAYVGNTGRSSGPHLHYEVILNGRPIDPMHYILN